VTLRPARLEPIFSPRPWGVRSLAPFFPEKINLAEPLGEAWLTGSECVFANGPFAGQKLGEVWPKMGAEWAGTAIAKEGPFPLLVKFIFAAEHLSVQVHPNDDYARAHEKLPGGEPARGKTEMWYAVNAQPGSEVLLGLKEDVTRESLERAIGEGTAEHCLKQIPMNAGDLIFVPAGTAHTIGGGLVLCEIQEHSDLTYRVYDYNRRDAQGRSRELHIAKALEVMRFGAQIGGKVTPARVRRDGVEETFYVACKYFATEKWDFASGAGETTSRERFEILVILHGRGEITWDGGRADYAPAQVWLLPAALGKYGLEASAPTSLLRTFVPKDAKDFARLAEDRGVDRAAAAQLVHE
jgi:mannose-6-phosphate isomerase